VRICWSASTNSLHQPQPQPSTRDAQPQAIVFKLHPTGIRHGVETGVEQFALGNSALSDLKFASTLVESISSAIISGVSLFDCVDESLPR